jgi:hypothetical protein
MNQDIDMGKCMNGDCKEPATVVNRGNRCTYCKKCNTNIDRAIEALRIKHAPRIKHGVHGEYWGQRCQ